MDSADLHQRRVDLVATVSHELRRHGIPSDAASPRETLEALDRAYAAEFAEGVVDVAEFAGERGMDAAVRISLGEHVHPANLAEKLAHRFYWDYSLRAAEVNIYRFGMVSVSFGLRIMGMQESRHELHRHLRALIGPWDVQVTQLTGLKDIYRIVASADHTTTFPADTAGRYVRSPSFVARAHAYRWFLLAFQGCSPVTDTHAWLLRRFKVDGALIMLPRVDDAVIRRWFPYVVDTLALCRFDMQPYHDMTRIESAAREFVAWFDDQMRFMNVRYVWKSLYSDPAARVVRLETTWRHLRRVAAVPALLIAALNRPALLDPTSRGVTVPADVLEIIAEYVCALPPQRRRTTPVTR